MAARSNRSGSRSAASIPAASASASPGATSTPAPGPSASGMPPTSPATTGSPLAWASSTTPESVSDSLGLHEQVGLSHQLRHLGPGAAAVELDQLGQAQLTRKPDAGLTLGAVAHHVRAEGEPPGGEVGQGVKQPRHPLDRDQAAHHEQPRGVRRAPAAAGGRNRPVSTGLGTTRKRAEIP